MKKLAKIKVRLELILGLIFGRYKHFAFFHLTRKDLEHQLIAHPEGYDVNVKIHGLQLYNIQTMIRDYSSSITEEDIILEKAKLHAEAELANRKRHEKNKKL